MRLGKFTKSPAERKRYAIDYSQWLDAGETIDTYTLTPSPSGISVNGAQLDATSMILVFFVSSGTANQQYTLDVRINTSGGQIKEDTVLFSVRAAS
jgi:hypothetical protein